MGGKGDIINRENMKVLYTHGCSCVSKIRELEESIEVTLAILKNSELGGEKGVACRQALSALSSAMNEMERSTEKAAIYMDAKLNMAKKLDSSAQALNAAKKKANYLGLKK